MHEDWWTRTTNQQILRQFTHQSDTSFKPRDSQQANKMPANKPV